MSTPKGRSPHNRPGASAMLNQMRISRALGGATAVVLVVLILLPFSEPFSTCRLSELMGWNDFAPSNSVESHDPLRVVPTATGACGGLTLKFLSRAGVRHTLLASLEAAPIHTRVESRRGDAILLPSPVLRI